MNSTKPLWKCDLLPLPQKGHSFSVSVKSEPLWNDRLLLHHQGCRGIPHICNSLSRERTAAECKAAAANSYIPGYRQAWGACQNYFVGNPGLRVQRMRTMTDTQPSTGHWCIWSHVCLSMEKASVTVSQLRPWNLKLYPNTSHASKTSSLDFVWMCFHEHKFLFSIFKNVSTLYLERCPRINFNDIYLNKNQATLFLFGRSLTGNKTLQIIQ